MMMGVQRALLISPVDRALNLLSILLELCSWIDFQVAIDR
jgi:hypothetical protein